MCLQNVSFFAPWKHAPNTLYFVCPNSSVAFLLFHYHCICDGYYFYNLWCFQLCYLIIFVLYKMCSLWWLFWIMYRVLCYFRFVHRVIYYYLCAYRLADFPKYSCRYPWTDYVQEFVFCVCSMGLYKSNLEAHAKCASRHLIHDETIEGFYG